jgi:hypothetical protein
VKKILAIFVCAMLVSPSFADEVELDSALLRAIQNCSGISTEFDKMKTMAGINTAVTGVGTLAGGGAIYAGFSKQSVDKIAEEIASKLQDEKSIEQMSDAELLRLLGKMAEYEQARKSLENRLDQLTDKSKKLGNWRTGLMAGNTATNIAGAIIAGNNKASSDLRGAIDDCRAAVKDLSSARMQARMDGADADKLAAAEAIIAECGKWEYTDTSKIDSRAKGAMWSSVAGAGMGAAGTITSAIANTDKTRGDNTDQGKAKEMNLNTASNVLAIGATGASLSATIFNATQIAAIKKASAVADNCERALQ